MRHACREFNGSCIDQNKYPVQDDEYSYMYHDSLRACVMEVKDHLLYLIITCEQLLNQRLRFSLPSIFFPEASGNTI